MANTVSLLSYANTFGDQMVTTNALVKENNDLAANNYVKNKGTLYLSDNTLGLQVGNNAIIGGQLQVQGIGSSAYIQNNLRVDTQVYFQNTVLGLTNSGQAIIGGLLSANGSNVGLAVANNTTMGGYLTVANTLYVNNATTLDRTLDVTGATTMANTLDVTGAVTMASTLDVTNNGSFGNNVTVVNDTNSYNFNAQNNSNTHTLSVRTNAGIVGNLFASIVQANSHVNTSTLSVTGYSFTNYLQANTNVNTPEVTSINIRNTGNTLTEFLRSNTSISTGTLIASGNSYANFLQANTGANTATLTVTGSTFTNVLQANSSVNTATLTVTSNITGNNLRSNNGISGTTLSISGDSNQNVIVANTSITTPRLSVNTQFDANGAAGFLGSLQTVGQLTVGGNFVINGNTVYNSPNFTLSAQANNQISTINVYRSPGANATIRWNETASYWDIKDVSSSIYYRILTEQQLTNSVTTVSSILGASATAANTLNNSIATLNGYLTSNVTSLQNQITANTTSLQNQITANTVSLQNQINSNVIILSAAVGAAYAQANTSSNVFFGTTGTSIPNKGIVSFASNNGVVISGTANTLYVNTPQNLRTTDSPTFNALTLTNALSITNGGTGATDKNSALFNLVPTTSGVPAGYVLATGGGGGSSFYWAAGGTGGGGGATPGTTIASSRQTYTGNGAGLAYSTPVYVPGAAQLRAYINGVRQFQSEYTETSGNTGGVGIVTFTTPPQLNDNILFEVDGYAVYPYYANNIAYTVNPTIGSANTIQLAIDGLASLAAPKASPTLTGTPTAPTAINNDTSTQIATTAYVKNVLNSGNTFTHSVSGNSGTTSQTNFSNLTIASSQVLSAANYNSYAPTLTGTGASGNWNISAAQLGGLSLQTSGSAPSGAQVFRSDVSGYAYLNYINSNTGNAENPTISQVIVTNGTDNFYRKASIAHLTSAVQSNASGTWNITSASTNAVAWSNVSSKPTVTTWSWNWSGQSGQPTWLWGSNDGTNMYVWNPSNFSVNYATSAGTAGALTTGNSYTVAGLTVGNSTSSSITMVDTDEGNRTIHCNSNRIGFLTQGGGWGAYCDDDGNWTAVGNVTAYSDEKLKTNWAGLDVDFIERLAKVKSGTFDRIDMEVKQVGVSAQSLQEVMPEAVTQDKDGILSVSYGNAALTAAVELAKEVVSLKEMLKELKAEIEVLKGNSK